MDFSSSFNDIKQKEVEQKKIYPQSLYQSIKIKNSGAIYAK